MPTTIGGKEVATTGSNHVAPGPAPAMSLAPPTPPAGPVPAPFLYICRSSTANATSSKLTIGGKPVLVVESDMKIEQPGNIVAKTTGADVVTHVANSHAATCSGADTAKADNKKICRTADRVYMNMPTGTSKVAQLQGFLIGAADLAMMDSATKQAWGAQFLGLIDPVSVATGDVFDEDEDLVAAGIVPISFRRSYLSSRAGERSPLGRGGWTHSLHQYVRVEEAVWVLRDATGRDLRIPVEGPDAAVASSRQHQLHVRRTGDRFEVHGVETELTRLFAPEPGGGPAMLRRIADAWGNAVELFYEGGLLVRAQGPSGRSLHLAYDARRRLSRVAVRAGDEDLRAVRYAYTDEGELASAMDAIGREHRYLYDGHHRLVHKALPSGLAFHYRYDEAGRCVRGYGDGGVHAATFVYDLAEKTTYVNETQRPRVVRWSDKGSVLSVRSTDGTSARETTYDDDLHPTTYKNAAGMEVALERDGWGRVVKLTAPGGLVVDSTWDERGYPATCTRPGGLVTHYRHDERGALVGVTYPSGNAIDLAYDGRGRLEGVYGPDGTIARFEYNERDDVIAEIGALGERTTYERDALGQIISRTDALGRTIRFEYDAVGQKIAHHDAEGNVTRFELDARGMVVRETQPRGTQLEQVFAGTKSLVEQIHEDGQRWRFDYDGAERVRAIHNPKHEVWELRYNRAGQLVEERPFDGRVLRYEWGQHEQLARIEAADGTYRQFIADEAGRRVLETTPHGDVEIFRDELGRIVGAVLDEPLGKVTTTFEYDELGRLVAEGTNGQVVRYEYGPRNLVSARILPGGETTRYGWDVEGRLAFAEHEGCEVEIERDAVGNEKSRRFSPTGVTVRSEHDSRDRLVATRVTSPAPALGKPEPILVERRFSYDERGWLIREEDSLRGTTRFEHDVIGQLREAQAPGRREIFDYDAAGSVVGVRASDDLATPWGVLPGNVLTRTDRATFEADDNRRRTKRVDDRTGETTEYLWDCRGRLREVRFANGERVIYVYDALGRRIRKDFHPAMPAPSEDTAGALPPPVRSAHYLWAGQVLAAEIDVDGKARVFVHEPGTFRPLFQQEGGDVYAYVVDHLGAPKELIGPSGAVAWAGSRTAFGAPVEGDEAAAVKSPFRLLGQYHDEETGLAHTLFRYFDADTARWLSPDPMGFFGGRNLAAFNGNPTTHTDPLGLYCALGSPAWDAPFRSCPRIPPLPGHYDVIAHGTARTVEIQDPHGNWTEISIKDLADRIRAQSDYVPGTPIRLVSCHTGADPSGVGQQLSNELGVPVLAPTQFVYPHQPGGPGTPVTLVVAGGQSVDPNTGVVTWTDPGTWVPHTPATTP